MEPRVQTESVLPPDGPQRFAIATVLVATLTGLVGLAVVTVLAIGFWTGRENTIALLHDKGELVLTASEIRLREQMDPAANQLAFIAEVLGQPNSVSYGKNRIADLLTGALAAAPQIVRVVFVTPELYVITAERGPDGPEVRLFSRETDPRLAAMVLTASARIGGRWDDPVYDHAAATTLIPHRHSVWRDGRFIGVLSAFVGVRQISNFLGSGLPVGAGGNSFVLYDREYVLGHSRLAQAFPGLDREHPLPRIDEVGDPVLANIWSPKMNAKILGGAHKFHIVRTDDDEWLFLYRTLYSYGDAPWTIGTYFNASDVSGEVRRLLYSAVAGLGVLVLASFAAVLLGHRLARPVASLAHVARRMRRFEFAHMPPLHRSRIKELDDQIRAFNDLLSALRWFESYVPRSLVRRLVQRRDGKPPPSVEREVTVMFTDVQGFTSLSERMTAAQTASLLNRHFALVTTAIEAEQGTVDKFIGDSVMAFWGAPERQADHAARAVRAALGIARAIDADNTARVSAGLRPLRMRVGLHTGPVVIGNIGAPGRVNYTIVGDTVNIAERIEELAREFPSENSTVSILASEITVGQANAPAEAGYVGPFTLRGRAEVVPIYRLASAARADASSDR
ncbi:MAG: adenylate/guanylate cyclase domain-containing protein [Rhodospirillales bacterium]|nr:adenylate/guanylate cyclase domain-containing protein [Rhodospirillales bacterium]